MIAGRSDPGVGLDGAELVDRLADHVHDAAEYVLADRHHDGRARVLHRGTAAEAVGGVHGDGADRVLTEVLGDLEDQVVFGIADEAVRQSERRVDGGELAGGELHVDDGAHDLDDFAGSFCGGHGFS